MTERRRRFQQTQSLEERLADEAMRLRQTAGLLPSGYEQEAVLKKAREVDTAAHISEWLASPGLRAPI